jgi:hypothetical protein
VSRLEARTEKSLNEGEPAMISTAANPQQPTKQSDDGRWHPTPTEAAGKAKASTYTVKQITAQRRKDDRGSKTLSCA